ncbi:Response regulator of the LytR/AlgR family [Peptoniphilus sp. ING2-D1G]|nr:Response regulator of the LytR/AlgR family [Peptoniphilus sp. ING2-D1G]
MKIAIVDDNKKYTEKLKTFIHDIFYHANIKDLSLKEFYDYDTFLSDDENLEKFDLYILDIEIKDKSGIELGKKIREKNSTSDIIYASNYPEYSRELHEIRIANFLIKGEENNYRKLHEEILYLDEKLKNTHIELKFKTQTLNLKIENIAYIESQGHKQTLCYYDSYFKTFKKYEVNSTLKEIEDKLTKSDFIKIRRSTIINNKFVKERNAQFFKMVTDDVFYIGKTYRGKV